MAELNVITWLWGTKYSAHDVVRLAKAVKKNLLCEHRFYVFLDRPVPAFEPHIRIGEIADRNLTDRSCFCRLRMFDPVWQQRNELRGKIISLDLDLVITGEIDTLFAGDATFKILQDVNEINPCRFNASVMMLKAGEHANVWNDFNADAVRKIPRLEFPDDQGWIWYKLPDADGWKAGKESGIYGFQKPGWPRMSTDLPDDARIVAFIGKRKPQMYSRLPWIKKHWINAA